METTDMLLLAGVGIAAWYFLTPSSTPTSVTTAPANSAPHTAAQTTLAMLQAMGSAPLLVAAQQGGLPANGLFTKYQWDWYLNQITGMPAPDIDTYLATQGPVSLSQYWNALMLWAQQQVVTGAASASAPAPTGISGLSGLGSQTQPGKGVNYFPPPASNGRFDLPEMGWQ